MIAYAPTLDPKLADLVEHAVPVSAGDRLEGFITSSDFLSMDLKQEWMISQLMVRNEPLVVGGPKKALKTSLVVDLAISLAGGFNAKFLGQFDIGGCYRVGLISGESGKRTLRQKALAICDEKGLDLGSLPLHWRFRVPHFSVDKQVQHISTEVKELGLDVMVFDPMYLGLLAENTQVSAGNVLQMGPILQRVVDACLPYGCTPVLVHHTKKLGGAKDACRPLDLDDLSQSGFAEFARQWMLVSRQETYMDGSGEHALWLRCGGSAGHSSLWALNVNEGKPSFGQGVWKVLIRKPAALKEEKAQQKHLQQQAKDDEICDRIVTYLREHPEGDTKTALRDFLGVSGTTVARAIEVAVEKELIEPTKVMKGGKKWDGYKVTSEAVDDE